MNLIKLNWTISFPITVLLFIYHFFWLLNRLKWNYNNIIYLSKIISQNNNQKFPITLSAFFLQHKHSKSFFGTQTLCKPKSAVLAYFSAVANINNYECFFFLRLSLILYIFLHQTMGSRGRVSGRKKVCPLYIIISCSKNNKTTNVCSGKFCADIHFFIF